eukprot:1275663-Alexandrium_andersonii.AAC.1
MALARWCDPSAGTLKGQQASAAVRAGTQKSAGALTVQPGSSAVRGHDLCERCARVQARRKHHAL